MVAWLAAYVLYLGLTRSNAQLFTLLGFGIGYSIQSLNAAGIIPCLRMAVKRAKGVLRTEAAMQYQRLEDRPESSDLSLPRLNSSSCTRESVITSFARSGEAVSCDILSEMVSLWFKLLLFNGVENLVQKVVSSQEIPSTVGGREDCDDFITFTHCQKSPALVLQRDGLSFSLTVCACLYLCSLCF